MADHPHDSASPAVSIVIPVYRSAEILPRLVVELQAAMQSSERKYPFELLLVCDASPDNSWSVIQALTAQFPNVRGVNLRKNAGQHNAVMAGLHYARGPQVVIMDDDLQHPPSAVPMLLAALDRGFDVCYTRYQGRHHSPLKKLGSWINDAAATLLLRKPRNLYLSSFKAMDAKVAREIIKYDGPYAYLDGLILDVTRHVTSIDIDHQPRAIGKGNYDFGRSLSLWLKMATSFSVYPLRLMAAVGAAMAFFSFIMIIYIIVTKFVDPTIPAGWTSLMAVVLFVGGLQMVGLGLIGEYLGRAYLKLNRKPQYVIRELTFEDET